VQGNGKKYWVLVVLVPDKTKTERGEGWALRGGGPSRKNLHRHVVLGDPTNTEAFSVKRGKEKERGEHRVGVQGASVLAFIIHQPGRKRQGRNTRHGSRVMPMLGCRIGPAE